MEFGYTATGLPLATTCTEQPFDSGQEETPVTDVVVGRDDDKVVSNGDKQPVGPQEWPGLRENPDIRDITIRGYLVSHNYPLSLPRLTAGRDHGLISKHGFPFLTVPSSSQSARGTAHATCLTSGVLSE